MRGGSGVVALRLLRELQAVGVEVFALAPLPVSLEREAATMRHQAIDAELRVTRYSVPTAAHLLDMGSSDPSYRSVEHVRIATLLPPMLRATRPDVVIVGRESVAWHVPDIAIAHDVPTVLLVHGGQTFSGLLAGHRSFSADMLLEQLRKFDIIVAVAQHLAIALKNLGLRRIEVVPNPVDLESFAPRPASDALRRALDIPPHSMVTVHISSLKEVKRPLDLIRAAEIASLTNCLLTYVIVGDGALRSALEEGVRDTSVRRHFRFAGWVDYWLVPDYINLADVVVMPSESEGQSLVYLETQACAKVILASDIPAAREVIVDGETGLLFRRSDVDDLAAKLLFAAARPRMRAAIGVKARAHVTPHASYGVAQTYIDLLRGLSRRHSGARDLAVAGGES